MLAVKDVSTLQVAKQSLFLPPGYNFKAALASPLQLSVRRKNTKEMFGGFLKSVVKSADEVLFSGVKVRLLLCLLS